ncbi:MAG TPA: hypothetical protein ENK57_15195 [Polyangiaceae bacterium]|nr:hypothetical protein [Polyangiaceae bacterium]
MKSPHMAGPRTRWAAGWVLGATLVAGQAEAGTFNADGSFVFDPTAVQIYDFEDGVPDPIDEESDPINAAQSDTALSGETVVTVEEFQSADFEVDVLGGRHTYRASMWVRGGEPAAYFVVTHEGENAANELSTLFPTGRVTSDGWVELANEGLRVDGTRSGAVIGVFSPGGGVEVDAIEIVVDGSVEGEVNIPCEGAFQGDTCGAGQICLWNECHNVNGWVPPIPADRDDVALYLENRIRFLFGPFINRSLDMPASLAALQAMKQAKDPWGYWNGFTKAVRLLHDGHTNTYGLATFAQDNPRPINVCFLEGIADESLSTAPSDPLYRDILVSHVGPDHDLGLKAGDRLVRVDGQHPIAWARSLVDINWSMSSASNHETFAELASSLRSFISRYAHTIEVIRCGSTPNSCGPVEIIDVSAIAFDEPDTPAVVYSCDNRPLRHLPDSPPDHSGGVFVGKVNEALPNEAIYGLEWESLYTTNGNDGVGAPLEAAVQTFQSEGATGVILDHRTGTGGTLAGPSILWSWAVASHDISYMETRQRAEDEQPTLLQGQIVYNGALSNGWVDVAGSSNPTTIPVALLLTEDVSASDWLPLGMKGAPNVRIFGPYQTNGAFSTRYELGYWFGINYIMASADTYVPDGSTMNGRGVEPDEIVFPLQSDLMAGKDTVFEAALQWVRQEMNP